MNNPSACPHFPLCSGCNLSQGLPPIWTDILSYFQNYNLSPSLIVDGFDQTRYKAKLAVRPGPEIGLFKKNTHQVLSIPHCRVHHSSINRAVAYIQEEMKDFPPYQENPPAGLLRYLQLFADRQSGKIQLALVVNAEKRSSILDAFCKRLLKHDLWHSIWLNFHPASSNRVLGDKWELIEGEPFLWQTLHNTPIAFHPGAFSQSHLPLFEKMLQTIDSWVEPQKQIIELYAGVGAISLSLSSKAPQFDLVENNPFAHLSFQQSTSDPKFTYHCTNASSEYISDGALIIVDPPRKGIEPSLIQKLGQLKKAELIYVSCNFESFWRNSEELIQAGWHLRKGEGYLLFPGTNHVEILAYFTK